jgi:ATP-dependent Lon protease
MEIINLSGYTNEEKTSIARKFLVPRGLKEHGLTAKQFQMSDEALQLILSEYTKEAGVRQLERVIAKLMRKTIQELLHGKATSVRLTEEHVRTWLGHATFKKTSLNESADSTGLAIGLAWTELGGDVLEIETSIISGKGNLTLTGQLGDVMQESAQAALSYIRARATTLGLKPSFHTSKDIHIHLPEGATPKDGPSAGITICAALISALTKQPLKKKIAMTGEITLRGRVLSVGGLREKLLAAKQHEFKTALVPHDNMDDIKDIMKDTDLGDLNVVFVRTMDEVLQHAFEKMPRAAATPSTPKKSTAKKTKKESSKK